MDGLSELVDLQALLTLALVSNVLVGLGRRDERRAQNRNGAPYAILAAVGAIVCVVLIVAGFVAIIGG